MELDFLAEDIIPVLTLLGFSNQQVYSFRCGP